MATRTDTRPPPAAKRRPVPSRKSGFGGTLFGNFHRRCAGAFARRRRRVLPDETGNPYSASTPAREPAREVGKDGPRSGKSDASSEKPRFDFYKILPGVEEPRVPKAGAPDKTVAKLEDRAAQDKAAKAPERFWLQAGSFASESDAENLKARLALAGWEAAIQPVSLADKGPRYRVRLGPYDNTDELNRIKNELAKRGFEAAVIK
jgi:cell division protein FtsN